MHVDAVAAKKRILVVDDEPLIGAVLQRILGAEHDVAAVQSGREALAAIALQPYDLILCDLIMPGMTGMELHAQLTARPDAHASRMVFLTGGAVSPQAHAFLQGLPGRCIDKPFNSDELRIMIRAFVASEGAILSSR